MFTSAYIVLTHTLWPNAILNSFFLLISNSIGILTQIWCSFVRQFNRCETFDSGKSHQSHISVLALIFILLKYQKSNVDFPKFRNTGPWYSIMSTRGPFQKASRGSTEAICSGTHRKTHLTANDRKLGCQITTFHRLTLIEQID